MSSESAKTAGSTKKKGASKKAGAPPKSNETQIHDEAASLLRKPELGMNPVPILTGYYGARGERIKHTVHDGALKLPQEALDIIQEAVQSTGLQPADEYSLPGLDCVIRPSLDPNLSTFVVTDIGLEKVTVPDPAFPLVEGETRTESKMIQVVRPKLENRTVLRTTSTKPSPLKASEQSQTERIRGGGEDDAESKMDIDVEQNGTPGNVAATSTVAGTDSLAGGPGHQPLATSVTPLASSLPPPLSGAEGVITVTPGLAPLKESLAATPPVPGIDSGTSPETLLVVQTREPESNSQSISGPGQAPIPTQVPVTIPAPAPVPAPVPIQPVQATVPVQLSAPVPVQIAPGPVHAPIAARAPIPLQPVPPAPVPVQPSAPVPAPLPLQPIPAPMAAQPSAPVPPPTALRPVPVPAPVHLPSSVPAPIPLQPAPVPAPAPTAPSHTQLGAPARVPLQPAPVQPAAPVPAPIPLQPAPVPAPAPTAPSHAQLGAPARVPLQPVPAPAPVQPAAPVPAPLPLPSPATSLEPKPVSQGNANVSVTPVATAATVPTTTVSSEDAKADPAPVPSSTQSSAPLSAREITQAAAPQSLSTKPEPRWELHRPGPNDEMVTPEDQLTPKPAWYSKDGIADIERVMLPEWFDGSAPHRTPEKYVKARETILTISETISNRNVTSAMVRRSIVGDAGSLQRLRDFMSNWGLINEDAINDSTPTAPILREKYPVPKQLNSQQKDKLLTAVVEHCNKRQKLASDNSYSSIDWTEIAHQVGYGVTPADCERSFLSMPINVEESSATAGSTERPITPEVSSEAHVQPTKDVLRQEFLRELVDSAHPDVIRKATAAALEATKEVGNLKEAQSGALLGLVASRAVEEAQKTESQLEAILSQLLDQRMKKLENRMAMMDDVESILEAEKMALELERRDLYTARCRHWFGGT